VSANGSLTVKKRRYRAKRPTIRIAPVAFTGVRYQLGVETNGGGEGEIVRQNDGGQDDTVVNNERRNWRAGTPRRLMPRRSFPIGFPKTGRAGASRLMKPIALGGELLRVR